MRVHQWMPAKAINGVILALGLTLTGALSSPAAAQTQPKLEASVFTYDGQDFVRTKTSLMTKEGKPAVNTKLEHDTPAYKALSQKHSFTGEATVFGRKYDASYAPITSDDGRLTGALFVGVPK